MILSYANKSIRVTRKIMSPRKFRLGDLLIGPEGNILKVVTVQTDCPYIENLNHSKTVVIFTTVKNEIVPVNGMFGNYEILRPV